MSAGRLPPRRACAGFVFELFVVAFENNSLLEAAKLSSVGNKRKYMRGNGKDILCVFMRAQRWTWNRDPDRHQEKKNSFSQHAPVIPVLCTVLMTARLRPQICDDEAHMQHKLLLLQIAAFVLLFVTR